jgi:hypothetical protein
VLPAILDYMGDFPESFPAFFDIGSRNRGKSNGCGKDRFFEKRYYL